MKSAFAAALIARAQLALARDNLKTLDDTERIQRLRAEKGDISELELLRIQVQRFTFERDAADASQALSAAKIALRSAAGAESIAEDFEVVGELGQKEVSLDKAVLMRQALDNRPDLRVPAAEPPRAPRPQRFDGVAADGLVTVTVSETGRVLGVHVYPGEYRREDPPGLADMGDMVVEALQVAKARAAGLPERPPTSRDHG